MQFNSGVSLTSWFSHTDFYLQSILASQGTQHITICQRCETAASAADSTGLSEKPQSPRNHPISVAVSDEIKNSLKRGFKLLEAPNTGTVQ